MKWLLPEKQAADTAGRQHAHTTGADFWAEPIVLPVCGYRRVENRGGEFFSVGWLFAPHFQFQYQRIFDLLVSIDALSLKAIIRTERGSFVFNASGGEMHVSTSSDATDSRLEVIGDNKSAWRQPEIRLMTAILD